MREHTAHLQAARSTLATLGIAATSLAQLRITIGRTHGVQITVAAGRTGHGILATTATSRLLITSADPDQQLHDLAHILCRHQSAPAGGSTLPDLHGRAAAGFNERYSPAQEHEAEIMRIALSEILSP